MLDCFLRLLKHVKGVSQVVVYVREVIVLLERFSVVDNRLLWLSHIVEGISQSDERLNLVWAVFQGPLVVLNCVLEVASLEKKIPHRDESKYVLRVQGDAFLEKLS